MIPRYMIDTVLFGATLWVCQIWDMTTGEVVFSSVSDLPSKCRKEAADKLRELLAYAGSPPPEHTG